MNRLSTAALALACAAAMAGPFAPCARSAPAPVLVTLKNGLRVVLAPDSAATGVDVSVAYAAGARTVPVTQDAVRHVAERELFLGDADGARARALTAEGGTAGSATTPDAIQFWETMPAEALGLALGTEAARMTPGRASPEAFEVARRSAIAEARGRAQYSPLASALTRLSASVFAGDAYARPLAATETEIAALKQEGVEAWRARYVVPANAVLTVVGRFEPASTLAAVRVAFESLPRGGTIARVPGTAAHAGPQRARATVNTPATMVLAGWRVPGASDPDALAIDLLAVALGGGEDSRINHALNAEARAATAAQCGVDRRREGSMLWAIAVPNSPADSAGAESALLDVVGAAALDPLSGGDFDRARAQFVTSELFRAQDLHARGTSLTDAVLSGGDPALADARLAAIARLTPADLQRVARRVLDDRSRTVLWLVPQGGAR